MPSISLPVALAATAVAGVGSAALTAHAAGSAADTQATAAVQASQAQIQAAQIAAQTQLGMFNTIRGDLSPYRDVGTSALPGYYALLGLTPPTGAASSGTTPSAAGATTPTATPNSNIPQVGSFNWGQVLTDRPDVLAEFNQEANRDQGSRDTLARLGIQTPEDYAKWWYSNNKPAEDTYVAPTWDQSSVDALYPASTQSTASGASTTPTAGSGFDPSNIQDYLENLPGYKFTRDQGMQAVTNSASARGLSGVSGAFGKGLARFVTGLADQTYGEQLSRIASAVGVGQSAANQTGAYGSTAASGAAGSTITGGNAAASGITGAANASAAGTVGAANAAAAGLTGVGNSLLTNNILGMYAGGGTATPIGLGSAPTGLEGLY